MEIDPNDFKQLLGLLQKLVEKQEEPKIQNDEYNDEDEVDNLDSEEEDNPPPKKSSRRPKVRSGSGGSNKKSSGKKKNKFVNRFMDMPECRMHKADVAIDKKLNKFPPTQRGRPFQAVEVRCRVCGKTEKVSGSLAECGERYKCNKCSTGPG